MLQFVVGKTSRDQAYCFTDYYSKTEIRNHTLLGSGTLSSYPRRRQMSDPSWNFLPDASCIICAKTSEILAANRKFEKAIAPLAKICQLDFVENFICQEDRSRFKLALNRVSEPPTDSDNRFENA